MRSGQFLRGYDACRTKLQKILSGRVLKLEDLYELARYPYYERDGQDWCESCLACDNREFDQNFHRYVCKCRKEREFIDEDPYCTHYE